jgi:hypothetical protein
MNSLLDLRSTLADHAELVPDTETVVRAAAVRHRVAAVRRRRRAVGTGALALVVATTLGVLGFQAGSSDPAPVVLGVQAPDTMTSLGYTYRADGWAHTVEGSGSVRIGASDTPRLISWTVQGSPTVRFVLPNGEIWSSRASQFHDFVALPSRQSGTLQIDAGDGRAGVATYALTDAPPDGYTKDDITFRKTVATTPLLGAVINDLGQTDVSTSYVVPRGLASVAVFCTGLPRGDAVHVSINGHDRVAGGCTDSETFDPGTGTSYTFRMAHPGRTVSLRLWVSDGGVKSRTPLAAGSAPRLRMGVGVYGPVERQGVGEPGLRTDAFVEHDGHLWMGGSSASASNPEDLPDGGLSTGPSEFQGPAEAAWDTTGETVVRFEADGMSTAGGRFPAGPGGMGDLWVPLGAHALLSLDRGKGPLGLTFYRRAD